MRNYNLHKYSEIPLLRPPKIKTSYLLKTSFAKFKLFFSSFSSPSVPLIRDHLWDCLKVVFKTKRLTVVQTPDFDEKVSPIR